MIRVLIADDHAILRRGLQQILAETSDMLVAGEASTAAGVLRLVREGQYDVLLLDISLPDQNGLEVLAQLHASHPNIHVLILSMHPEQQYALRALKCGASGYLTKDNAPEELIIAIRRVVEGGQYISQSLAEHLVSIIKAPSEMPLHESLSDREYQVMQLLGVGKSVGEIAHQLALSPKTVSTYRHRILEKLALYSTADIIRYAIEHEMV
ncbi:MAG: response regulator transcription factor [Anaerolineales bacterium]|nr:response regulator transcription factor [Anaerolineales bacterium]